MTKTTKSHAELMTAAIASKSQASLQGYARHAQEVLKAIQEDVAAVRLKGRTDAEIATDAERVLRGLLVTISAAYDQVAIVPDVDVTEREREHAESARDQVKEDLEADLRDEITEEQRTALRDDLWSVVDDFFRDRVMAARFDQRDDAQAETWRAAGESLQGEIAKALTETTPATAN